MCVCMCVLTREMDPSRSGGRNIQDVPRISYVGKEGGSQTPTRILSKGCEANLNKFPLIKIETIRMITRVAWNTLNIFKSVSS